MLNISIVQITVILAIVVASIVLGRWLGRKSNPKLKESVNVSPRKVKFFYQQRIGIQRFSCFSVSQRFGCWRGGLQNI